MTSAEVVFIKLCLLERVIRNKREKNNNFDLLFDRIDYIVGIFQTYRLYINIIYVTRVNIHNAYSVTSHHRTIPTFEDFFFFITTSVFVNARAHFKYIRQYKSINIYIYI